MTKEEMANLIDREALSTYLTIMIQVCESMTGMFGISDTPEVKAEIKAYQAVLKDVQKFPPALVDVVELEKDRQIDGKTEG